MALSLIPRQLPEQRMHTLNIEDIFQLGEIEAKERPPLEHYFSPTRKEQFIRNYIHYLNSSLLKAKQGYLDTDLYLVLVLSFQFVAPFLEIQAEKELVLFYRILQQKYGLESPDINLHFTTDEFEEGMMGEEEAMQAFRDELDNSFEGNREVKESVQKRLKQDGIEAIMKWQRTHELPELAEAFGRSIVIPSFFTYRDKKLVDFYRRTTTGISYEVAVPDLEEEEEQEDHGEA